MRKTNLERWIADNAEAFLPPICNKLLYRGDRLSVMLVGGPNQRRDFHTEEGSEFFFQLDGEAEIITLQQGKEVGVPLHSGDMYLLPSRVPHSPQRGANSMGLVIERNRLPGELDALTWYADKQGKVEFQRYFECHDLGKDLVVVVNEYKAFLQGNGTPAMMLLPSTVKQHVPSANVVPEPVQWATSMENLFEGHPDNEFYVRVLREGTHEVACPKHEREEEVFLLQLQGQSRIVHCDDCTQQVLEQGECCVLVVKQNSSPLRITHNANSAGLVVMVQNVHGNKTSHL